MIILGIVGFSFPFFSNIYNKWITKQNFTTSISRFDDTNNPKRLENLHQAQLYNTKLSGKHVNEEVWAYEQQLTYNSVGIMGWVEIPKIDCILALRHGVEANVLMAGVGHLEQTSLPIGGESSHCAVSAHTGMAHMEGFDNLNKLEIGDKFIFWTLGEAYCYEVYDIETVKPDDSKSLAIQHGRDLATLITCTPYGLNTHRLLVHGQRCPYEKDGLFDDGIYILDYRLVLLIIAILLCILYIVVKKRKQNKVLPKHINKNLKK